MSKQNIITGIRTLLLSSAAAAGLTGAAMAQQQTAATANANCLPTSPLPCMADNAETVLVTGTRIARPEVSAPSPIITLDAADLQASGSLNLGEYLTRIPALKGSLNDFNTSGYATPAASDGSSLGGLNLLNLRNLGYVRTLVLIDGHRTVSDSTGSAAVDVNTIPITLIERIDTDTAGDSAIYGADGVSGVVNFIMKHDLEGVSARIQAGAPQDGGGSKFLVAFSAGHNFDDGKGNITATFEGSYQDKINFTQRSFTKVGGRYFAVANPTEFASGVDNPATPDFIFANNAGYITSGYHGAIDVDFDGIPDYQGNGQVFHYGTDIGNFSSLGGDGMPYAEDLQGDFQPINRRRIAEFGGHYDFASWLTLSADIRYGNIQTKSTSTAPFDDIAIISSDNAFLPPSLASIIAGNGGQALLAEDYLQLRNQEEVKRQTMRSLIEAKGDLGDPGWIKNLHYEISYVYGQTDVDDIFENNRVTDRFFAALDSVIDPATGQPTCRTNLNPAAVPPDLTAFGASVYSDTAPNFDSSRFGESFTPGPGSGCVAFNPFDPNANQPAAVNFVSARTHTLGVITQHDVNGYLAGDFPQLQNWGLLQGPVSVVLGGEYRKESSKSDIDPNFSPDNLWAAVSNGVSGRFFVWEAFAEISIPVLKDQFLAKELTFDLAGRESSYSTAGDNSTWKVSGVWQPFDFIRFRGTEAYAVRAPNIGELFSPVQLGFALIDDPCDRLQVNNGTSFRVANCQALESSLGVPYTPGVTNLQTGASTQAFTGGNTALSPEEARTTTAGIVLTPLDGLVITADWYNVNITRAIEALDAQTIAEQCVDLPSTVGNPYCTAVQRYGAAGAFPGALFSVSAQQINVAASNTAGLDLTLTYGIRSKDWLDDDYGNLRFHIIGNYLDKLRFIPLAGQPAVEGSGTSAGGADGGVAPKWSTNIDVIWDYARWSVDWNIDWTAAIYRGTRVAVLAQPDLYAQQYMRYPQRFQNDVQVSYLVNDNISAYVGIQNLFYQKPAIGAAAYPYDPIGRFFYLGFTAQTDYSKLGL